MDATPCWPTTSGRDHIPGSHHGLAHPRMLCLSVTSSGCLLICSPSRTLRRSSSTPSSHGCVIYLLNMGVSSLHMSMSRAGQLLLLGLVAASCVFAQSTTSAASAAPSSTVPTSASSDSPITHTVSVAYVRIMPPSIGHRHQLSSRVLFSKADLDLRYIRLVLLSNPMSSRRPLATLSVSSIYQRCTRWHVREMLISIQSSTSILKTTR